jgi:hypothetical protein
MHRRRSARAHEGHTIDPRDLPPASRRGEVAQRAPGRIAVLCVLAAASTAAPALASGQVRGRVAIHAPAFTRPVAAATLEACQTSAVQAERSATFVGEMTAVPGTARMFMRIDVLERSGGESTFRNVTYPGLGNWLRAAAGVKTYKNLDRVTDLAAPAEYRAAIRFHWLNARGRLVRSQLLRTPICTQPAVEANEAPASTAGSSTGA